MSKMSELYIEIEELLMEGMTPSRVADSLGVPLEWVKSVEQTSDEWYDYDNTEQEQYEGPF